jgi:hypothetical protein
MSQPSNVPRLTAEHLAKSEAQIIRGRYQGATAVILASGPSLSDEQIETTRKAWNKGHCVVITVNSTWRRLPQADLHFSNDADWFALNLPDMLNQCRGEFWCSHPGHTIPQAHYLPFDRDAKGLTSSHRGAIVWGGNSGAGAISFAALTGCRRVLLAGYDQQGDHWHDPHPKSIRKGFNFPMWAEHFKAMADDSQSLGIEVINCSRQTSLDCFAIGDLEQELGKC